MDRMIQSSILTVALGTLGALEALGGLRTARTMKGTMKKAKRLSRSHKKDLLFTMFTMTKAKFSASADSASPWIFFELIWAFLGVNSRPFLT